MLCGDEFMDMRLLLSRYKGWRGCAPVERERLDDRRNCAYLGDFAGSYIISFFHRDPRKSS